MAQRELQIIEGLDTIFQHPEEYAGSLALEENITEFGYDIQTNSGKLINHRYRVYALLKIIDEILTNASDNAIVDKTQSYIKIMIGIGGSDKNYGTIIIENDGAGIPNTIIKGTDMYAPILIFTKLGISSNYSARGTNEAAGQYGVGATVTTAFSSYVIIENTDSKLKTKLTQKIYAIPPKKHGEHWRFNDLESPKIEKLTGKNVKGKVRVIFKPDIGRLLMFGGNSFGGKEMRSTKDVPKKVVEGLIDSAHKFLSKRAAELSSYLPKQKISLNNEAIQIRSFRELALSLSCAEEDAILHSKLKFVVPKRKINAARRRQQLDEIDKDVTLEWEYIIIDPFLSSAGSIKSYSLVNAIPVVKGEHVNSMLDIIANELTKQLRSEVSRNKVAPFLFFFIKAPMVSPRFRGKTKEEITGPAYSIPPVEAKERKLARDIIDKFGLADKIKIDLSRAVGENLRSGLTSATKARLKSSGNHTAVSSKIPKAKRVLLAVEGASAANAAAAGRTAAGKREYGIFKFRGKLLNVRKNKTKGRGKKKGVPDVVYEFLIATGLDQVLGKKLSPKAILGRMHYGKIIFMTDQDVDGYHIRGLLINLFQVLVPRFLQSPQGKDYLNIFSTPIVRIKDKGGTGDLIKEFYTVQAYEAYMTKLSNQLPRGQKAIYYKGLGSATKRDNKELFMDIDTYVRPIAFDKDSERLISMMFGKDTAPRKTAINEFNPDRVIDITKIDKIALDDFVFGELVHYSMDDVMRHIPDMYDGLKPVNRKAIYTIRQGRYSSIKIKALVGKMIDMEIYHHGDAADTVAKMTFDFTGNNIPLIQTNSSIITRAKPGKDDITAPRYAFVSYSTLMDKIFPPADDALLPINQGEDPKYGEPYRYMPIFPMLFALGTKGSISTGFSAKIPQYNPFALINLVRGIIENKEVKMNVANISASALDKTFYDDVTVWFANFTGEIIPCGKQAGYKEFVVIGDYKYDSATREFIINDPPPVKQDLSSIGASYYISYEPFRKYFVDSGPQEVVNPVTELSIGGRVKPEFASDFAKLNEPAKIDKHGFIDMDTDRMKFAKKIRLCTIIGPRINTMNTIDENYSVVSIRNPSTVIIPWFAQRTYLYTSRKKYQLAVIDRRVKKMMSRVAFIEAVIGGKINMRKMSVSDLIGFFKSHKVYYADKEIELRDPTDTSETGGDEIVESDETSDYAYLTSMTMLSMTTTKLKKLKDNLADEKRDYDKLKKTKIRTIWLDELNELEKHLTNMYRARIDT